MYNKFISSLELCSASAIAGSSVVVGKLITGSLPVFLSQSLSLAFALLILIPVCFATDKKFYIIKKRDLCILFLQALSGMFLFRVFIMYGLKYTTAVESGIITSTTPAIVAVLSFAFLRENIARYKILGVLITTIGVLAINSVNIVNFSAKGLYPLLGNLLVLFAVTGEALLTILRKMTSKTVSSLSGTTFVTLFAFILFLPISLIEIRYVDFLLIDYKHWSYIVYYGIVVTSLAYILWFRGVSKVPASTAAIYTGFMPVSSVILSYIILRESFLWVHMLGVIFIVSGIITISFFARRELSN
ncbi:MAG: DMT family transporter [Bacillota bacterium]